MNACTISRTPPISTSRRRRPALFPTVRRCPFPVPAAGASTRLSPRNRHNLRAVLAAMTPCAAYRLF